ncbi:hypothetical protein CXG81DRAFT_4636, partial [Caulochytrium protostelioides]
CDAAFHHLYRLKSHMICHTTVKNHVCPLCAAAFARKHDLSRHMRALHSGRRPFSCPLCRRGFNRLDDLERHH